MFRFPQLRRSIFKHTSFSGVIQHQNRGLACVHGDTFVKVKNSNPQTIKELYKSNKPFETLSFNLHTGQPEYKRAMVIRQSEKRNMIELIFNNGSLRCTPDHNLLTYHNTYVIAHNCGNVPLKTDTSHAYFHTMCGSKYSERVESYDLVVEENNNYFVVISKNLSVDPLKLKDYDKFTCDGIFVKNCGNVKNLDEIIENTQ